MVGTVGVRVQREVGDRAALATRRVRPVRWRSIATSAARPASRVGLGQGAAVVEDEDRHAQLRVQLAKQLLSARAVDDIDLATP